MGQNLLFFLKRKGRFSPAVADYFARLRLHPTGDLRLGGAYDRAIAAYIDRLIGGIGIPETGAWQLLGGYAFPGTGTGAVPGLLSSHAAGTLVDFVTGDWNAKTGAEGNGTSKHTLLGRMNDASPQDDQAMFCYITVADSRTSFAVHMGAGTLLPGDGVTQLATGVSGVGTILRSRSFGVGNEITAGTPKPIGLLGVRRVASDEFFGRYNGQNFSQPTSSIAPANQPIRGFSRGAETPSFTNARQLLLLECPALGTFDSAADVAELDAATTELANALAAIP